MPFSKIYSAQSHFLETRLVSVETDISRGLYAFSIVGLAGKAVEEARDRVGAAIKNSGFKSPKQTNSKTVVSLAPADMRKEGPTFDVPIALGYLLATGDISFETSGKIFAGELALNGEIKPLHGALSLAKFARAAGFKELYIPQENAAEGALIEGIDVYGIQNLKQIIEHFSLGEKYRIPRATSERKKGRDLSSANFDDVVGQETAKRGLTIAAAGRHNVVLFGPPGTGKTMLARRLQGILPPLSFEESLEVTEIHSILGGISGSLITEAPVRAPHHTASYASIVGGGTSPRPGEITLAHKGILFMDEFPEFDKRVLEALREPMEEKCMSVSRSKEKISFPADFMLVAAMNPCPCGNKGIKGKECLCTAKDIFRYERKLSGPIADRIDMWIEVSKMDYEKLAKKNTSGSESECIRNEIVKARSLQAKRFQELSIDAKTNANVDPKDMERAMIVSTDALEILQTAAKTHNFSGRGYHKTVKLSRTIADLAASEKIKPEHVLEALQYREKFPSRAD